MSDGLPPTFSAAESAPYADVNEALAAMRAARAQGPSEAEPAREPLRDEKGRFASAEPVAEAGDADSATTDDAPAEKTGDAEDSTSDDTQEVEAAEAEPQPAIPIPAAWGAADAPVWDALPAEAKAVIAEREAQRETAIRAKLQEVGAARRAAEEERQRFVATADQLLSILQPQRPPLDLLRPDSEHYNPEAYHAKLAEFEAARELREQLQAQRDQALAEAQAAEAEEFARAEREYLPKLRASVPDLFDAAKAPALLQSLRTYALAHDFHESDLGSLSANQIHILWKAQQYDAQKAAAARVAPRVAPKPASPPIKPNASAGVRAGLEAEIRRAREVLEREGTIEAALAYERLKRKRA